MPSDNTNKKNVSQLFCVVQLDFRQWTGMTVLSSEDFHLGDGGSLPPSEAIGDLGSKRICDPKLLKEFSQIKKRAVRLLEAHGVQDFGGYAIPLERSKQVLEQLQDLKDAYNDRKAEFVARYNESIEEWIAANPQFANNIRAGVIPREEVETRIYADFNVFKIQPVSEEQAAAFEAKVNSLGEKLIDSVVKTAEDLYRNSFLGRDFCNAKILSPLKKIRERLDGLSFLDSKIQPIVTMIDNTLRDLPKEGPYKGNEFVRLLACCVILADRNRIRDMCDVNGQAYAGLITDLNSTMDTPDLFAQAADDFDQFLLESEANEQTVEPASAPVIQQPENPNANSEDSVETVETVSMDDEFSDFWDDENQ